MFFSMSFIFVLFMLHLLTVCALYVCLCDYVNIFMYLVLLCIFGKKLLRACVYCYTKNLIQIKFSYRLYMYVCIAFTCLQTVWVILKYACSSNQVNIYACVSYKGGRLQLYGSFLFIFF